MELVFRKVSSLIANKCYRTLKKVLMRGFLLKSRHRLQQMGIKRLFSIAFLNFWKNVAIFVAENINFFTSRCIGKS